MHAMHSLKKLDVSGLLLVKVLLQFYSKQPPPVSDHKLFAF